MEHHISILIIIVNYIIYSFFVVFNKCFLEDALYIYYITYSLVV